MVALCYSRRTMGLKTTTGSGDKVCLPDPMFPLELQDNAGTEEASTVCKGPGQDRNLEELDDKTTGRKRFINGRKRW